jgi:ammonium transporter, Amt family
MNWAARNSGKLKQQIVKPGHEIMINRFFEKLKDPRERKFFAAILGGKTLGLGLCLLVISVVSFYLSSASKVHAQTASPSAVQTTASPSASPSPTPEASPAPAATPAPNPPYVNPMNTMWVLVTAFLVFFMQAGFMFLEAGFARTRESINVMLEGVVDTCLCGILFYAWGFACMFGHGNGFIGWGDGNGHLWFFLQNLPDTYESTGVATIAIFLFQFAFADTCSTITSGAMVGRTGFWGDLWYSLGVSGIIYPIFGHWAWGPDGWLNAIPFWKTAFHDFAGSTVVHTIGGMIALAGAIVLGPRLGRTFKRDGGGPMPAHNLLIASVGAIILWFGWYGFNPGSTLSAMDYLGVARVATNTTLAACAGGLLALFYMYPRTKKWDCGMCLNGLLAGLVAITCPCYWVSPFGAIMIGAVAGVVVVWGTDLLEWLRIDDPCGAWPVHGAAGMWGTYSLGLFATGQFGASTPTGADTSSVVKGLFYGGGIDQLVAQFIGNTSIGVGVFVVALVLMYAVKATGTLRVSEEGELEGLDLHEHGTEAYPEAVIAHNGRSPALEETADAAYPTTA